MQHFRRRQMIVSYLNLPSLFDCDWRELKSTDIGYKLHPLAVVEINRDVSPRSVVVSTIGGNLYMFMYHKGSDETI